MCSAEVWPADVGVGAGVGVGVGVGVLPGVDGLPADDGAEVGVGVGVGVEDTTAPDVVKTRSPDTSARPLAVVDLTRKW